MTNASDGSPTLKTDRTFHEVSLYGSQRWCAARLGLTFDKFRSMRSRLERDFGFPPIDTINDLTIKADVDAWVKRRRRLSDVVSSPKPEAPTSKVNWDAL